MRILRRAAAILLLAVVGLLFALSRLGSADPVVALRRTLHGAGYERVSVAIDRAPRGLVALVIDYDPAGQPPAAVERLTRRAVELAWTRGGLAISSVSVRPRGGPVTEFSAQQLAAFGSPPSSRERYADVRRRAGRVTALALLAVVLTGALVIVASAAAVAVARPPAPSPDRRAALVDE